MFLWGKKYNTGLFHKNMPFLCPKKITQMSTFVEKFILFCHNKKQQELNIYTMQLKDIERL